MNTKEKSVKGSVEVGRGVSRGVGSARLRDMGVGAGRPVGGDVECVVARGRDVGRGVGLGVGRAMGWNRGVGREMMSK